MLKVILEEQDNQTDFLIFFFDLLIVNEINPVFVKYVISLTKKENPKICFIPTDSS